MEQRWDKIGIMPVFANFKPCKVLYSLLQVSGAKQSTYFSKCPVGFDELYAFSCLQLLLSEIYQVSIMLLNLDHLPFLGSHTS